MACKADYVSAVTLYYSMRLSTYRAFHPSRVPMRAFTRKSAALPTLCRMRCPTSNTPSACLIRREWWCDFSNLS